MKLCGATIRCGCGAARPCRRLALSFFDRCTYHRPRKPKPHTIVADYEFFFVLPNEKDDGWRVGERPARKIGGAA